jgi:hypothetical protein
VHAESSPAPRHHMSPATRMSAPQWPPSCSLNLIWPSSRPSTTHLATVSPASCTCTVGNGSVPLMLSWCCIGRNWMRLKGSLEPALKTFKGGNSTMPWRPGPRRATAGWWWVSAATPSTVPRGKAHRLRSAGYDRLMVGPRFLDIESPKIHVTGHEQSSSNSYTTPTPAVRLFQSGYGRIALQLYHDFPNIYKLDRQWLPGEREEEGQPPPSLDPTAHVPTGSCIILFPLWGG